MIVKTAMATVLLWAGAVFASCPAYLDHDFRKLHSADTVNLCQVSRGKPMLIVNTASHCGYSPQFKRLEALYRKHHRQAPMA
jgi:glutathione peroxidase